MCKGDFNATTGIWTFPSPLTEYLSLNLSVVLGGGVGVCVGYLGIS